MRYGDGLAPWRRQARRRVRFGLGLAVFAFATLSLTAAAFAAPGGNSNKGDVWVDNVGQPAGPGHENDPHLGCSDINLWGANLADSSGTYTIDGWPPSGRMEQTYPASGDGSWTYDHSKSAPQVLAVIHVSQLISNAVAKGDTAQHNQGFHFKLMFGQDPQKHKVFWVHCTAPTSVPQGSPWLLALGGMAALGWAVWTRRTASVLRF